MGLSEPNRENIEALMALEVSARRAAFAFRDVCAAHWTELSDGERRTCKEALEHWNRAHRDLGMVEVAPLPLPAGVDNVTA